MEHRDEYVQTTSDNLVKNRHRPLSGWEELLKVLFLHVLICLDYDDDDIDYYCSYLVTVHKKEEIEEKVPYFGKLLTILTFFLF